MTSATGLLPAKLPATTERTIPGLSPALRQRLRRLFRILSVLSPALTARLAMRMFLTPIARRVGTDDTLFLASARTRVLTTGAGRVRAYEWPAHVDSGKHGLSAPPVHTVLVVHGWISHAARMAEVIRELHARGLRVLAFDAPAHGRSSGTQADLQAFRSALAAVLTEYSPVEAVLAHSFGALTVATWLAEDQPAQVRAAVLIGMMNDVGYIFESFTQAMAMNADVIARFRELFRARYGGYAEEFSAARWVPRISLPVLLVHGSADEIVPATHATEIAAQLRQGQMLLVDGLGHSAPLRDPATVARIADFLVAQLMPMQPTVAHQVYK